MARGSLTYKVKPSKAMREIDALRLQFNALVDEFDALCTKLNADAGVTDTNYGATQTAKKIL